MKSPKLTELELKVMETLWKNGASSIREIQETFSENERPAYTTVQTTVYRMENKKVVHRVKKIGNAHIFDASISRNLAHGKLIDHFLDLFGGSAQPVMSHLIETGKLTLEDLEEAKEMLIKQSKMESL
jgi:BlaI family penicillinase repressor